MSQKNDNKNINKQKNSLTHNPEKANSNNNEKAHPDKNDTLIYIDTFEIAWQEMRDDNLNSSLTE